MKAKLKASALLLFTPLLNTSIGGQAAQLSEQEVRDNWHKYLYTPVASVYENLSDLRSKLASVQKKDQPEAIVLDMSKAKQRGRVFAQPTKKQQLEKAVAEFQRKQGKKRARLQAQHEATKKPAKRKTTKKVKATTEEK